MSEVKAIVLENGPLKVSGPIQLQDAEGTPIETKKDTVFLCRCGASTTQPFCDGTHSRIGFKAAKAAVAESSE